MRFLLLGRGSFRAAHDPDRGTSCQSSLLDLGAAAAAVEDSPGRASAYPRGMIVAHLDMDAFFAAVEELERPELRGKPLVVGGDPHGRGVVATASYEARAYGIRSAMSAAEALRRCPHATFVRPDFERYRACSRQVWAIVHELVGRVEQVGIDEGYLDLAPQAQGVAAVRALLAGLQASVLAATQLGCSLGCGTSKTVAKIASDREKPRGLVL